MTECYHHPHDFECECHGESGPSTVKSVQNMCKRRAKHSIFSRQFPGTFSRVVEFFTKRAKEFEILVSPVPIPMNPNMSEDLRNQLNAALASVADNLAKEIRDMSLREACGECELNRTQPNKDKSKGKSTATKTPFELCTAENLAKTGKIIADKFGYEMGCPVVKIEIPEGESERVCAEFSRAMREHFDRKVEVPDLSAAGKNTNLFLLILEDAIKDFDLTMLNEQLAVDKEKSLSTGERDLFQTRINSMKFGASDLRTFILERLHKRTCNCDNKGISRLCEVQRLIIKRNQSKG